MFYKHLLVFFSFGCRFASLAMFLSVLSFLFFFFFFSIILLCPTLTYLPARGLAPGGLHLNISFYNYTMRRLRLVRCEREPMIIV